MTDTLHALEATILSRRGGDASASYVAKLFGRGRIRIAQKFGEEAVETVIAALGDDRRAMIGESADLLFHLIVLLAELEIPFDEVLNELRRREGVSGLAEKAARKEG